MGIPDEFVQHGSREILLNQLHLSSEGIADRLRRILADSHLEVST
jgi:deoxyxylulose-5-phosphate synthase